jgi:hypothetical protein
MQRTTMGAVAIVAAAFASGCGAETPYPDARPSGSSQPKTSDESAVGSTHRIPEDFPIDRGLAAAGWQVSAPTHENTGAMPMDICGDFDWQLPLDRLQAGRSNDEDSESRVVYLFGSPDLAHGELSQMRTQADACTRQTFTDRGGETTTVTMTAFAVPSLPPGAETVTLEQAISAEYVTGWLAVRRGPAILVLHAGVGGPGAADKLQSLLDDNAQDLYPEMCTFPEAGC